MCDTPAATGDPAQWSARRVSGSQRGSGMKLELQRLSVRYGSGRNALTALDGIDLTVNPGETVGLVGESGCGKSTVARAIVGLVPISGGRILLDGKDYSSTRSRGTPEFRRRVQM